MDDGVRNSHYISHCQSLMLITLSKKKGNVTRICPFQDKILLVCYTAVFSVVTQREWGETLRDDPKNGCVADYYSVPLPIMLLWSYEEEIKQIFTREH